VGVNGSYTLTVTNNGRACDVGHGDGDGQLPVGLSFVSGTRRGMELLGGRSARDMYDAAAIARSGGSERDHAHRRRRSCGAPSVTTRRASAAAGAGRQCGQQHQRGRRHPRRAKPPI